MTENFIWGREQKTSLTRFLTENDLRTRQTAPRPANQALRYKCSSVVLKSSHQIPEQFTEHRQWTPLPWTTILFKKNCSVIISRPVTTETCCQLERHKTEYWMSLVRLCLRTVMHPASDWCIQKKEFFELQEQSDFANLTQVVTGWACASLSGPTCMHVLEFCNSPALNEYWVFRMNLSSLLEECFNKIFSYELWVFFTFSFKVLYFDGVKI